jgi:phosphoribosyl-ATP pyrophosphohydrolase/phosphoribosyl-AMP cyclohydrolase
MMGIVCSIDLMDGKAVQLRQGKTHVLTAEQDPITLVKQFARYGEVAVIDLDAAMKTGKDNLALIESLCQLADIRVGGGIRDVERATRLLKAGAQQLIIGTAATPEFLAQLPKARVSVALDHLRSGEVVDHGWQSGTGETLHARAERLAPYCSGFLCTFVEDEGGLGGLPLDAVKHLKETLPHPITVAGGVKNTEDAIAACLLGVDVQVGMALYTGLLDPVEVVVQSCAFDKYPDKLIPTIVQDRNTREVLMLAFSSPDSLRHALKEGVGAYYSRSRKNLWVKGATSGHTQTLTQLRVDCDGDTLLFQVHQQDMACHRETPTCFSHLEGRFQMVHLFQKLQARLTDAPEGSYTRKLFDQPKLLQRKLMEEAFETTQATTQEELIWELGDVLFFLATTAVAQGISWQRLESELAGRMKPDSATRIQPALKDKDLTPHGV